MALPATVYATVAALKLIPTQRAGSGGTLNSTVNCVPCIKKRTLAGS